MLTIATLYLGILGFKFVAALAAVRQSRRRAHVHTYVSAGTLSDAALAVVQPILSGDPDLLSALTDNLRTLQCAALVWLVDDDDTVAQRVVRDALRTVPHSRVRVMRCAQPPEGINPKTYKLQQALDVVGAEIFVVLDDDTRLSEPALRLLCDGLCDGDLSTALPSCTPGHSIGDQLLAQFVNNNAALTYLPLLPFGAPISINGMCYGLRTAYLRSIGGFAPLLAHLTDDLAMAQAVRANGGRIVQTIAPVVVHTSVPTLRRYRQQMHRWFLFATLLLRTVSWPMRCAIALLQGVHPILLWMLLITALTSPSRVATSVLLVVLFIRSAVLIGVQRLAIGASRHDALRSIISELLQPLHLIDAACNRTIIWRTRRFQVRANDDFAAV
jgi:ceramide glucosyltransferase